MAIDLGRMFAEERKKAKRRARIAEEKRAMAKALLAAGRPYEEVARAMDISVGSVHNIMKESREDLTRILNETRARIGMKYLLLSDHVLGRIDDHDINKASLKDKAVTSAILADKALKFQSMTAPSSPASGTGEASSPPLKRRDTGNLIEGENTAVN